MLKSSGHAAIRLRGVRHNNLKNFDLDLPLNRLVVITGLSGSGKSSLAFDTLFAEGQRRYIETFSPYARQFFDRMDKPQVDSIEGIPPAIAIEQRNAVKTTRSTVGTMTEVCEYMKTLWPHIAQLHCRQCGRPVRKDSPQNIWQSIQSSSEALEATRIAQAPPSELLITFDLPLTEKLSLADSLALVMKQGYQRLLLQGRLLRVEEATSWLSEESRRKAMRMSTLTVVQDRLKVASEARARFMEACEQAYHFGKGKLMVWEMESPTSIVRPQRFSNRLHCARCDIEYREPSPALFSFNHPVGACPTCRGFGRVISIDYNLAMPDRSKTLAGGVVKPWQTGHGLESQRDLLRACRHFEIPTDVPFEKLAKKWQTFVVEGDPDYGKDEEHQWPRAWYGVKGYFRWLESKAYKMHVRVLLSRYRAYTPCPECQGKRFQPETLLYRIAGAASPGAQAKGESPRAHGGEEMTLAGFYQLPIRDALCRVRELARAHPRRSNDPIDLVLNEVSARLGYLNDVGLGYLTLDRPTRSLSGGETERVNLTTCLGTRLVNTLFVLDEPSVGLHPRDTARLVRILQQLRDAGNTVVVVEHEASIMRAANQLIDLGPGHGATGGQVVFQGSYTDILRAKASLTGEYLSGRRKIAIPDRRPTGWESKAAMPLGGDRDPLHERVLVLHESRIPFGQTSQAGPRLKLAHASRNNLKDLTVEIPLRRFVCITGVSGSGKTTLIREVLLPALSGVLKSPAVLKAPNRLEAETNGEGSDETDEGAEGLTAGDIEGWEHLDRVELVDQSILGKTPRSNPAVYIGAFEDIRELFAQSEPAKQRGLNASAFSFNSAQGQCERCRGAGFEKIEMQFLSDVFIRCPDCGGRRYRAHILEIKLGPGSDQKGGEPNGQRPKATAGRAHNGPPPRRASGLLSIADLLDSTVDEAIGFLTAFSDSRPAQRAAVSLRLLQEVGLGYLKLGQPINTLSGGESQRLKLVRHLAESTLTPNQNASRTLFLFDEPTTGLHFDDVRVLLKVFQRLVDIGHSLIVIEHNLDVIKCADWVIDLGPEAGDEGGRIVAQGTPEDIADCPASHTGQALQEVLESSSYAAEAERSEPLTRTPVHV